MSINSPDIFNNKTITITYCDVAENHIGMQQYGNKCIKGYTEGDILIAKNNFENIGCTTKLINLSSDEKPIYILIIRNGINILLDKVIGSEETGANRMYEEQINLPHDKKALMRDRFTGLYSVKNKRARHNLVFGYTNQLPDYENGKGTIVNFNDVPFTNVLRYQLEQYVPNSTNLVAEGNYYYQTDSGITYHCDLERKKVIGVRLGSPIPLCFQWFSNGERIGDRITIELYHGDIYVLQEEALGKNSYTHPVLKHAAGSQKYIA